MSESIRKYRCSRWLAWLSAGLLGMVAICVSTLYLDSVWMNLGLRRPLQNWMSGHGLGAYAGKAGIVHLEVPNMLLASVGGAILARVFFVRWLSVALLFSAILCLGPWIVWAMTSGSWSIHPWSVQIRAIAFSTIPIPFGVIVARIASRSLQQRESRRRRGLCLRCGYDLGGNTSGVCPECGTAVTQQATKTPQGST